MSLFEFFVNVFSPNFRLPFSRSSAVGYIANMFLEILFIVQLLGTHAGVVCLFIACNRYIQCFCNDLATVFDRMNDSLKENDHLGAEKLSINAIEFLITIDE